MNITHQTITVKGTVKVDLKNDLDMVYTGNAKEMADAVEQFVIGSIINQLASDFPHMVGTVEARYCYLERYAKFATATFEAILKMA
jgi:hypothetical protein